MKNKSNKKNSLAKKWLLVLCVVCMGFLVYDIVSDDGLDGSDQLAGTVINDETANIEEPGSGTTGDVTYYEDYKLEREQVRSKEIELLDEIVNNPNSTDDAKNDASKRKISIAGNMEQELIIENLLKAKNFQNSAAFIQEDKVTIVLDGELDDNEATQVADVVDGVTGIGFENVNIVKR